MRIVLAAIAAISPLIAQAAEEDALAARVMWTSFECGTYAEVSGDAERHAALFEKGMAAGRQFFAAIEAGTITQEEQEKHVPIIVLMTGRGPSVDFALGRIFESAMTSAYDEVVKKDITGLAELPASDWVMDKELQKSRAQLLYQRGNCSLL